MKKPTPGLTGRKFWEQLNYSLNYFDSHPLKNSKSKKCAPVRMACGF